MHYDRWARVITQWVPEDGRRCRGRPRKRWRDDLDAFMRDWPEKAIQWKEWKAMVETFAQQREKRRKKEYAHVTYSLEV